MGKENQLGWIIVVRSLRIDCFWCSFQYKKPSRKGTVNYRNWKSVNGNLIGTDEYAVVVVEFDSRFAVIFIG